MQEPAFWDFTGKIKEEQKIEIKYKSFCFADKICGAEALFAFLDNYDFFAFLDN